MWKPFQPLYNLYRRWFGHYTLDDPRPIQKESPYTYFLPTEWQLANLRKGDLVKLTIRSHPPGLEWNAERMWVEIIDDKDFVGVLANVPSDMPQLRVGDKIHFQPYHVIDTDRDDQSGLPKAREYWQRCLVDKCVTDGRVPVQYLYREAPDETRANDKYPDSGWRIRGDYRGLSDEEIDARETEYVALGRVLNSDDSWVHLIDEPVGAAYIRDFDTDAFVIKNQV